jgi:hypothetical protein
MVGVEITSDEAGVLYDDRSAHVHGGGSNYTEASDEAMERYNRFETVLRCALLRAGTDAAFCKQFSDDGIIVSTFG